MRRIRRFLPLLVFALASCGDAATQQSREFGYLLLRIAGPSGVTNVRVSGTLLLLAVGAIVAWLT